MTVIRVFLSNRFLATFVFLVCKNSNVEAEAKLKTNNNKTAANVL